MIKAHIAAAILLSGPICLSACASSSVTPIGQDTYMITDRASNGYTSAGKLKANIYKKGVGYCKKQGKEFQPLHDRTVEGIPNSWTWASVEVQFRCLDKGDSELGRPTIKQDPNIRIESNVQEKKDIQIRESRDMYTELKKLKELLDSKIITQEEFDAQKKKILAK